MKGVKSLAICKVILLGDKIMQAGSWLAGCHTVSVEVLHGNSAVHYCYK